MQQKIIKSLEELNHFLIEINEGGIHNTLTFDSESNSEAITLHFTCDGGVFEVVELFVQFQNVQIFQLGVSMQSTWVGCDIHSLEIDSLESLPILPKYIESDNYCYRFYCANEPTPYYVVCENVHAWLEGYFNKIPLEYLYNATNPKKETVFWKTIFPSPIAHINFREYEFNTRDEYYGDIYWVEMQHGQIDNKLIFKHLWFHCAEADLSNLLVEEEFYKEKTKYQFKLIDNKTYQSNVEKLISRLKSYHHQVEYINSQELEFSLFAPNEEDFIYLLEDEVDRYFVFLRGQHKSCLFSWVDPM